MQTVNIEDKKSQDFSKAAVMFGSNPAEKMKLRKVHYDYLDTSKRQ